MRDTAIATSTTRKNKAKRVRLISHSFHVRDKIRYAFERRLHGRPPRFARDALSKGAGALHVKNS